MPLLHYWYIHFPVEQGIFHHSTRKNNLSITLSFLKNSFYSTCRTIGGVSRGNGVYDGWTGTYDAKTARWSGFSPRLCALSTSWILWSSFVIVIQFLQWGKQKPCHLCDQKICKSFWDSNVGKGPTFSSTSIKKINFSIAYYIF